MGRLLVGLLVLVGLSDGLPVYISRDDTTISTRFPTALEQLSLLRGRSIHD
jgi:hypothetical protein